MKKLKIILILSSLYLSCNSENTPSEVQTIHNSKDSILSNLLNKSVLKSRGENYVILMTYSDKKKNIYNFEIMSDSVNLLSDVIEFKPDSEINCQQKEMDSVSYDDCLITQISVLLKFMDSYQIRDASAEFSQFGIDLKLYLYSGKEIVYVSNPHKVIKSEWKNYLQELTKIDENWYYSE